VIEQAAIEQAGIERAEVEQAATERAVFEHERLGTHYFDSSSGAKAARAGLMSAESYSVAKIK
jgi:hypothetical protein